MRKTIVCLGTLDTKGQEVRYLKEAIEARGHRVLLVDHGIMGQPSVLPDITREQVARAAGRSVAELLDRGNELEAVQVMIEGLRRTVKHLFESGQLDGVISIAGGMGTSMATAAMRDLPIGVPKLVVSTKVAHSGVAKEYMGTKDITMVSSVADIAGLNRLTRKITANAAGAIVGMVEGTRIEEGDEPVVVVSMNGTTTPCASAVMAALQERGYEVVVFHSIGVGGRALEEFVRENPIAAVIEIGLNEIGNELFDGMAKAGADRLEAAGERGVPQIVTPGSVDFINFLGPESIPARYRDRRVVFHNPQATGLHLTGDEMARVGEVVAGKLNRARGPVRVLIPLEGFSCWDRRGKEFFDPEADRMFLESLRQHLTASIPVVEVEANINDEAFSRAILVEFDRAGAVRPVQ